MNSAELAANIINNLVESDVACQKHEFFYFTEIVEYTRDQTIPEDIRKYINVLAQATLCNFKPEETHNPFEGLEYIQKESLNALDEVCAYLSSRVLKARIQDILWLRTKKAEHAEKAIEFYKDCVTKYFNTSNYYFSIKCAERALSLASLFRKKNPELRQSIADILLQWVRTYSELEEKFLTANAIELLAKFNYATNELHRNELHSIATKTAQYIESKNNFYCAKCYRIIATRLADKDTAFEAQTALAECYVKLARSQKNTFGAVDWMKQAITAYKQLPNTKEIRAQLYAELLEYQKASLPHFSLIEYPININDMVEETMKIFEGKNIRDALLTLAFMENQPNYTHIREEAKKNIKKYPLQSFFGKMYLDNEGKIIAQPKINSSVDADNIHPSKLYEIASIEHKLHVLAFIRPAVEIILLEHPLTENDFLSIVINNPFVEPTQVLLYAKGLYAGMIGDYVVSTSILIPLLENSIRYVLKCYGEQVSSLNSNGIQEVLLMNALLEHEKTQEIFGEDTVLDLKGLLIDRTYGNLRNNVSHGLTSSETFRTEAVVYLWWLILRLCLFPYYDLLRADNNLSSGGD